MLRKLRQVTHRRIHANTVLAVGCQLGEHSARKVRALTGICHLVEEELNVSCLMTQVAGKQQASSSRKRYFSGGGEGGPG